MITQQRLKDFLLYSPDTGVFTSKISRGCIKAGNALGWDNGSGYIKLAIDKRDYFVHRLAYLYVHGYMPECVDHINGIKHDNRICNLRAADSYINARNSARKHSSLSRFRGVNKNGKGWYASIRIDGCKYLYLGRFLNEVEAAYAYDIASLKYHGNFGKRNFLPLV